SRRRHTRWPRDWSSDVYSSDLVEQVEDRYTNGVFSGNAERAIDLVHSDEANPYINIFDYLRARVPGLTVEQDGLDYTVMYRQSRSEERRVGKECRSWRSTVD